MTTLNLSTVVLGLITTLLTASCMKHHENAEELNIDYPALYVVNGQDASISVIALNTNAVTHTISLAAHGGGAHAMTWPHHIYHHHSSGHHRLAVGIPGMDLSMGHAGSMPHGGKVAILNAVTGTILKVIDLPSMNHNAIFSPDGKEIWTTQMTSNGTVRVYDANTYELKSTIHVGTNPAEVTFSSDGGKAYVSNGGSNTVTIINPITKSVTTTVPVGHNPVGAWPSSIGKMFVDNEDGQTISVIDVMTNQVSATINLGFKPGYAAYYAQGSELWVSDATHGKIVYFQDMGANNWMKHGEFATGTDAHAIVFHGNVAYVTNQGANNVSVINAQTHTKIKDIPVGHKPNGAVIKL